MWGNHFNIKRNIVDLKHNIPKYAKLLVTYTFGLFRRGYVL